MLCYPRLRDVLFLHDEALRTSGGMPGIRELGLIDSALARPRASFGGRQLYRTRASPSEIVGMLLEIEADRLDVPDIARWLLAHARSLPTRRPQKRAN